MMDQGPFAIQFDGFKTLPLYTVMAKLNGDLAPLSKGSASFLCDVEPKYSPPSYKPTPELLNKLGRDAAAAITAIQCWQGHAANFMYFVQFKDDPTRELIRALHDHTLTLSILCDSRLKLDPTPLWNHFDCLFTFAHVHYDYREDLDRDAKWDHYAMKLKKAHERMTQYHVPCFRLVERMVKQIELQSANWPSLPEIHASPKMSIELSPLELFYSYSHKDEDLCDQLLSHLSGLRRQGVSTDWHYRCISAGQEWEGQIDEHLNSAHIILVLISSAFLDSDYCNDVELKRALERHEASEARVIPVILRACDWQDSPLGKLQALPKGGRAVQSWQDIDEAFTDVAKSIRATANELKRNA